MVDAPSCSKFGNSREPGGDPLRDAKSRLDAAVRTAYGMSKDADILAFLLDLNLVCAPREAAGEAIIPPGLPLPENEREEILGVIFGSFCIGK